MRGLLSEIIYIINQNPEENETSTRITFSPYPASFISRVPYGGKAGMDSLPKCHDGRSVHPGLPP
jgi:hypothetical protein